MPVAPFDARLQPIEPELDAPTVEIAKNQPPFLPIVGKIVRHPDHVSVGGYNTVVLAFRPTKEQREAIEQGEDIYIALLTFMEPMQGIIAGVGKDYMSAVYNVAPTGDKILWERVDEDGGSERTWERFVSGDSYAKQEAKPPLPGPVDPPTPPHPKPVG